jgi:hypothetical protein
MVPALTRPFPPLSYQRRPHSVAHVGSPWGPCCRAWFHSGSCLADAQGRVRGLGMFKDPVSAAIRYDAEAIRIHGKYAILNFPSGSNPNPTTTGMQSQAAVTPDGGGGGQGRGLDSWQLWMQLGRRQSARVCQRG